MASRRSPRHSAVKSDRYVTLAAYYDGLPDGWASFPECTVHGWLVGYLRDRAALDVIESVPERLNPALLASLVASPPEWIPEIIHVALALAIRDAHYSPTERGEADFLAWLAQLNRELFGRPGVKAALEEGSAATAAQLPSIWGMFHRGTPMTVRSHSEVAATIVLAHPAGLFPTILSETQRRALALLLAQGGAAQSNVTFTREVDGSNARTLFEATWS